MHQSKSASLELVILVLAPLPSLFSSFSIVSSFGPVVLGPAIPIPLKSSFEPNMLVTKHFKNLNYQWCKMQCRK